jgi:hypothetical protein
MSSTEGIPPQQLQEEMPPLPAVSKPKPKTPVTRKKSTTRKNPKE